MARVSDGYVCTRQELAGGAAKPTYSELEAQVRSLRAYVRGLERSLADLRRDNERYVPRHLRD